MADVRLKLRPVSFKAFASLTGFLGSPGGYNKNFRKLSAIEI